MQKNYFFALGVFILLLAGVATVFYQQAASPAVSLSEAELASLVAASTTSYIDTAGNEIIVAYAKDVARVTGGYYDGVTFRQVEAASGAKYEAEQGLTLWSKGDEVQIITPQAVVFLGTKIVPPLEDAPPLVATPSDTLPAIPATTTNSTSTDMTNVVGPTWVWQKAMVSGEPLLPKANTTFSVTFTPEGQVRGVTDCNGFGGDYTLKGDTITMGEFMSTMMYCEGSQESEFTALFKPSLTIASVTSSELVLKNAAGDTITLVNQ